MRQETKGNLITISLALILSSVFAVTLLYLVFNDTPYTHNQALAMALLMAGYLILSAFVLSTMLLSPDAVANTWGEIFNKEEEGN